MYVSNRKRAYKVLRRYKTNSNVKLLSCDGAEFITTEERLAANGYKEVKYKPNCFNRVAVL